MRTIANLLTSTVLACWVVAIAVLAVQNAEPVSLKFLTFESIQIPFGLVLAFCGCCRDNWHGTATTPFGY